MSEWAQGFRARVDQRTKHMALISVAGQRIMEELRSVGLTISIHPDRDDFFNPSWTVRMEDGSLLDVDYDQLLEAMLGCGAMRPFTQENFVEAWRGVLTQNVF